MKIASWLAVIAAVLFSQTAYSVDLVVIVNRNSGVDRLTRYQVLDIFLGRYRTLPSGVAALPIDLGAKSVERETFYRIVARKDPAEISSYWARLVFSGQASPPFQITDARAAVDLVAGNTSAIAYVDRSVVDHRVKVVLELAE